MPDTLVTARLHMRAPNPADVLAIFAYAGDPDVTRFMEWPTHVDQADTEEFVEAVAEGWDDGDDYCYVLARRDTEELVGAASVQFDEHGASLGYIVAAAHWGQGLATEAAQALRDEAWQIDDLYRFWATVDVDNLASVRVLEKIGMCREARLARWSPRPNLGGGVPRDVEVYALTR
ncbi:MAG: GNAT family N-acetyltransferase [Salinisphaera sp.]|jgi:ribosomal-protein-alanine N-acetyltransferase|nr:GNAT family N-acetyltransferase [Salinisphaera sp.]